MTTGEWVITGMFVVLILLLIIFARQEFKKDKAQLDSDLHKDKITALKDKQKKHFKKMEEKIAKVEQKNMPKENTQFSAYAMANDRVKSLIETFGENFEVDMHEWEKNLFALAYERGYSDGKYDYKQSLLKEEKEE